MATISRRCSGLIAVLCVLVLTGCVESASRPSAASTTSDPTTITSEADALISATAAYKGYSETTELILRENGSNPERLDEFTTIDLGKDERSGFEGFAKRGLSLSGASTFGPLVVQSYDPFASDGVGVLKAYVCVDISGLDVVDNQGVSVVNTDRPFQSTYEVTFDTSLDNIETLLVAGNYFWSGESVCS